MINYLKKYSIKLIKITQVMKISFFAAFTFSWYFLDNTVEENLILRHLLLENFQI